MARAAESRVASARCRVVLALSPLPPPLQSSQLQGGLRGGVWRTQAVWVGDGWGEAATKRSNVQNLIVVKHETGYDAGVAQRIERLFPTAYRDTGSRRTSWVRSPPSVFSLPGLFYFLFDV